MQAIATSWLRDSQEYKNELQEIERAERQAEKDLAEESQKWQHARAEYTAWHYRKHQ